MNPVAATPMAFVRMLLLAYEARGMAPSRALLAAQIAPHQVAVADATITSRQLELLAGTAMHELDDEGLGWFSRRLPWGSYGMLARASLSAPSLGVALARWCRHHHLLTDSIELRLERVQGAAVVQLLEHRPIGPAREFCLVTLLRNLFGVACWLIDSRIGLQQVELPYAAPAHAAVYPVLFPGPVRFGAARAALQFDARYLALPLRRDDKALDAMLAHALALIVRPYRRDRLLVQRVRTLLLSQPGASTADALAHALNVSTRTLHRQLQEEGASLQALKDDVRQSQAMALLGRSNRPVKQVALAVGFGNEKSFARAFRQWTGESPADYRIRVKAPA